MNQPIEIVGGGVAGLSLAIALRKAGVDVTLKEAGTYPRHRLCGEFINGVSDTTLQRLGLESLFSDAQRHQEMKWWLKGEQIAATQLPKPVKAISRWTMDARMVSLFRDELGGKLLENSREPHAPRPGRVWTAGRRLQKGSAWLGLKAHFLGLEMDSGLEMHLGDGGYVGLTPVEDGRVNVCGLFERRKEVSGKGSELLLAYLRACGFPELVARLQKANPDESSLTGVSGIGFGQQEPSTTLLALGDAERMIPPFTGNGMSMALEAAECALDPLLRYAAGQNDWEEVRVNVQTRLQNRFQRRITTAQGIHHLILHSPSRELLAAAAKPGLLPFGLFNRILT